MNTTTNTDKSHRHGKSDFKQYLRFEKLFGYVHDLRVIPNSSPSAYVAKVSVPQGQGERVRYVNFELNVKSADALVLFLDQQPVIVDDNKKVTVRFACHSVYPKAYIAKQGKFEGQVMPYFSAQLSYLFAMKVDGQFVYGERLDAPAS